MDTDASTFRARVKRRLPNLKKVRDLLRGRAQGLRRRFRGDVDESVLSRVSQIDEEYVERGAEDISDLDLDTVVQRAEAIEERFRADGPLRRLLEDGRLLLGMVRDARRGR